MKGDTTMTAIATLHDLMVHQLRDIYSAEKQLVTALPKVAKKAHAPELAAAIRTHLAQTEQHVQRLEQVFRELGESPRGVTCKGMKGLIEESDELLGEEMDPSVLDAGIIADAQRIEHYEIAAYGTVCEYARSMGHTRVASLLHDTLEEEKNTDKLLSNLAEGGINSLASRDGLETMGGQDRRLQL
jgi:ferritin-like metal-binding protein YciE